MNLCFLMTSFASTFACAEFMKALEKNPQYESLVKNPNCRIKKK